MSYKELKKTGMHYFNNRKQNMDVEISEEDMKAIDTFKQRTYIYPSVAFFSMLAAKFLFKYIPRPVLFDNPIEPEQRAMWRRKFFSKFFGNQMIFVCTVGAAMFSILRYEFAKYYIFLKYENLVDAYLDARDSELIKSISNLQIEATPIQNITSDKSS